MEYQDSYSFEIAVIFLGGDSEEELRQQYQAIQQDMAIDFAPVN